MNATTPIPTVGRRVWYWANGSDIGDTADDIIVPIDAAQACDAGIVYVGVSGLVNLSVTDHDGKVHARRMVRLLAAGEEPPINQSYATWMPYQMQQPAAVSAPAAAPTLTPAPARPTSIAQVEVLPASTPQFDALPGSTLNGFLDPLLDRARLQVIESQNGSSDALAAALGISTLHAGELMEALEREGVVGPETSSWRPVVARTA